jgi:hypothetical protein
MSRRKLTLIVLGVLLLALIGPFVAITRDSSQPETRVHELDLASVAAKNFMDNYVQPNGQVGQGGIRDDLQVQGMLIAAAIADRARFEAMVNMYGSVDRPGNFGAPTANELAIIRAHLVASERLSDPKYADSVKQRLDELLQNASPSPQNSTADVMQFRTFQELYELSGDERWNTIASTFRTSLAELLDAQKLPGDAFASGGQNYSAPAQMLPLWLKDSCNSQDTDLAKKIWLGLRDSTSTRVATELTVDAKVVNGDPSALAAVATAATAEVAGEHVQAAQLLERADVIASDKADAESAAAAALGRIVVSTDWLGAC